MPKGSYKGFASPDNKTSKELSSAKFKSKVYHSHKQFWHQDYVNSPAQYQMTFLEYKKLRKNKRKFEKWVEENSIY